jgi:hypothetical protein
MGRILGLALLGACVLVVVAVAGPLARGARTRGLPGVPRAPAEGPRPGAGGGQSIMPPVCVRVVMPDGVHAAAGARVQVMSGDGRGVPRRQAWHDAPDGWLVLPRSRQQPGCAARATAPGCGPSPWVPVPSSTCQGVCLRLTPADSRATNHHRSPEAQP